MRSCLLATFGFVALSGGCSEVGPTGGLGGEVGSGPSAASGAGGQGGAASSGSEGAGAAGGGATDEACLDLAPSDPATNRAAIQACLDGPGGRARLRPGGVYEIDDALRVGAGDVLEGQSPEAYAVIQPAAASAPFAKGTNAILHVSNEAGGPVGGTLRNVKLDMRDARPDSGSSIFGIRVAHDRNLVERVEITSSPMPWRKVKAVSLYFGTGYGNKATDVFIHHAAFGVAFVNGITEAMSPWVHRATISENRGDAVTFAGYGKVTESVIHANGFDDGDSGAGTRLPPGGALYASHVNQEGGWIEGNTIFDQCGTNLELNMTRNFRVVGNVLRDPGWPGMNGKSLDIRPGERAYDVPAGFCKSAMSVLVIATSDSVFQGNTVLNHDRPANTSGSSSNGGAEEWFGPNKSDLPVPESTSLGLAFVLGRAHADSSGGLHYAVRNEFAGNYFASAGAGAAGLGFFAGRGTGFSAGGGWNATQTANVFNDNSHCDPAGPCSPSPHSKRCGKNRYATGTATCAGPGGENLFDGVGKGNACNRDDFLHQGEGHDALRNDGCPQY